LPDACAKLAVDDKQSIERASIKENDKRHIEICFPIYHLSDMYMYCQYSYSSWNWKQFYLQFCHPFLALLREKAFFISCTVGISSLPGNLTLKSGLSGF
jgi:hypothetical protein